MAANGAERVRPPNGRSFQIRSMRRIWIFGRTVRRIKSKGKSKGKKAYEGKPAPRAPGRGSKQQKHVKAPYPHFRKYKKVEGGSVKRGKHPKLILKRVGNQYVFMGLTESAKRGHHANFKLDHNPEKGNGNVAYIRKELRCDSVDNFGDILENYQLSDDDKARILELVKSLKNKKSSQ